MKSTFQLKANFEIDERQQELEEEMFRRTTEMREEADLDHVRVNIVLRSMIQLCNTSLYPTA